jgi:hypothetical protein
VAVDAPPAITTDPAEPLDPEPTMMEMEPPEPPVADPDASRSQPLLPDDDEPLLSDT